MRLHVTNLSEKYVSRRTVAHATMVGMVGLDAALAGNTFKNGVHLIGKAEAELWPQVDPSLTFLDGEGYKGQREIGLFLPGYNDANGMQEAIDWRQYGNVSDKLPIGYLDYGTVHANIGQLADKVREQVDLSHVEAISLFGSSMGGLYAVALAAELGVPVRSLVLCSSPSTFNYAMLGEAGQLASKLPTNRGVATIMKYGASLVRAHQAHPDFGLLGTLDDAGRRTFAGSDPVALENQLKVARAVNIANPSVINKLDNVFIPGISHVLYAATQYANSDKVVQVVPSANDFELLFAGHLKVPFTRLGVNYMGHANVQLTAQAAAPWIGQNTNPQPLFDLMDQPIKR